MQKQKKNDNKTKKFKKAKKIFGGRVAEQQDDRWKDLWKEEEKLNKENQRWRDVERKEWTTLRKCKEQNEWLTVKEK